jgi:predicted amidohydrolase YtcJ
MHKALFLTAAALALPIPAAARAPADTILFDAHIATQDDARHQADALAVRGDRLVAVGSRAAVMAWRGPHTRVIDAHGRRVVPGLVDAHLHPPLGLYPLAICDLNNAPHSLAELSAIVHDCVARYHPAPGAWLNVAQWNYASDNATSAGFETIRKALDRAAPDIPVQLVGSDFHHGAYNSAALALAHDDAGTRIGLTAATLAGPLHGYATFVGVDARGEPDGRVNETARMTMPGPTLIHGVFDVVMRAPEKTVEALNSAGITAIQDAAVTIGDNDRLYTALEKSGRLTVHVNMLPLIGGDTIALGGRMPGGGPLPLDQALAAVTAFRARFAQDPLIRVTGIKMFVDGVLEANPLAVPPTMPNSPSLKPYLQPIFRSEGGDVRVVGYVDPDGAACRGWAATSDHGDAAKAAFLAAQGYHPDQCARVSGAFVNPPAFLNPAVAAMHHAGFDVHLHAIGDGAVAAAIDAIEAARAADPGFVSRDAIAHLQIVSDRDIARAGRDHIIGVYTLSWAGHEAGGDIDVVPFVENVLVNGRMDMAQPDGYYDRHAYPAKSMLAAGGVLAAGSDAPVSQRGPIPFVNMAMAVTRANHGQPVLGPQERLTIGEELDAYTRGGAFALRRETEIGSLEPGKSADFVMLDRDILAVPASEIADTRVLQTWFRGRLVYTAKP